MSRLVSFYQFRQRGRQELEGLQATLRAQGHSDALQGSICLSPEGCNGNLWGTPQALDRLLDALETLYPNLEFRELDLALSPFLDYKVSLKKQLLRYAESHDTPPQNYQDQKEPAEWDEVLAMVERGEAQLVDVRNDFEFLLGTFPGAINPETRSFREFSEFLDQSTGSSLKTDLPTAIFCTGGIRCEIARTDMENRGFTQIWQLKGGILNYLQGRESPQFEGDCFVFDERVALDKNLTVSPGFDICPACRGPRQMGQVHDCGRGRVLPTDPIEKDLIGLEREQEGKESE